MTKSKKQKRINQFAREHKYIPADFKDIKKGFILENYERNRMLEHCHKNRILWPGNIKEGDTVYIMRARAKRRRRKKYGGQFWKVKYYDSGNGFIQLANIDEFDKEGAEKNVAFLRSHNFNITDVWNLETAFTLFFLPRLKVFIESTRYGVPGNIYHQYIDKGYTSEEADKLASEEWENILKRMYEGLVLYAETDEAESIRKRIIKERGLTNQQQLWDIEHEMERDAQDLFGKHFFSLWD